MTLYGLHHLVLRAGDDLPAAERHYADLFGFDVLFREGVLDGEFGAVPDGADWEDATDAGVEPRMSFLGRDDVALALVAEPGDADAGRLDHVALAVDDAERETVGERARERGFEARERDHATFVVDGYGVEWELNASSSPPETGLDELDV